MTRRRFTTIWIVVGVLTLGVGGAMAAQAFFQPGSRPAAQNTYSGNSAPGGPVVAFYGDSYTLGTGASTPDKRWSTIVCAERDWNEVNPSVNGLGFVNHRDASHDLLDQIVAADPDIVFVTMGLNDNFSMPSRADDIRTAIQRDFDRLSTELPHARIIVVEPFWYTDERPESVQQIIDWVAFAAARIGADVIPGASHWIEDHPEWMAADGLHPNDAGYAEMAKRMDAELWVLGL